MVMSRARRTSLLGVVAVVGVLLLVASSSVGVDAQAATRSTGAPRTVATGAGTATTTTTTTSRPIAAAAAPSPVDAAGGPRRGHDDKDKGKDGDHGKKGCDGEQGDKGDQGGCKAECPVFPCEVDYIPVDPANICDLLAVIGDIFNIGTSSLFGDIIECLLGVGPGQLIVGASLSTAFGMPMGTPVRNMTMANVGTFMSKAMAGGSERYASVARSQVGAGDHGDSGTTEELATKELGMFTSSLPANPVDTFPPFFLPLTQFVFRHSLPESLRDICAFLQFRDPFMIPSILQFPIALVIVNLPHAAFHEPPHSDAKQPWKPFKPFGTDASAVVPPEGVYAKRVFIARAHQLIGDELIFLVVCPQDGDTISPPIGNLFFLWPFLDRCYFMRNIEAEGRWFYSDGFRTWTHSWEPPFPFDFDPNDI